MIPSSLMFKRMKQGLQIPDRPYFKIAHEYLGLHKLFLPEDSLDCLVLVFDLLLYPIWILCSGNFTLMDIFPLMKCGQMWKDLFRYQELSTEIWYWKFIVKLVGGPWISTNDPNYHVFVYSDAMVRLSS